MQLLISVTSVAEARAALRGSADIVDIKNPAEGALGAAPVPALHDICHALPPGTPISAALGDSSTPTGALALAAYGAAHMGVGYVKVGLLTPEPDAALRVLQKVRQAVALANPDCRPVAVGYADAAEVAALSWRRLPELAAVAGFWGCLIDTAQKDGRTLFDHCGEQALQTWLEECHSRGLHGALAGSLALAQAPILRRLQPDVIGFRGAACQGDRVNGQVDETLVAALGRALGTRQAHALPNGSG